jgi:hypothetical protein
VLLLLLLLEAESHPVARAGAKQRHDRVVVVAIAVVSRSERPAAVLLPSSSTRPVLSLLVFDAVGMISKRQNQRKSMRLLSPGTAGAIRSSCTASNVRPEQNLLWMARAGGRGRRSKGPG